MIKQEDKLTIIGQILISFGLRWAEAWGLKEEVYITMIQEHPNTIKERIDALTVALRDLDIPLEIEDIERAFNVKMTGENEFRAVLGKSTVFPGAPILSPEVWHMEDLLTQEIMWDLFKKYVKTITL